MPRIYNSRSEPIDFCKKCFPEEDVAEEEHGNVGEGPDERGNCYDYNVDHPDYEGEYYTCESCGKKLKEKDN